MDKRKELEKVRTELEKVVEEIVFEKAHGNLSTLINLREKYAEKEREMLDNFFDEELLRKKYNAWDEEEDEPNLTDFTNCDLEKIINDNEIEILIQGYKILIDQIQENI